MSSAVDHLPVQEAFSRQSGAFDAIDAANPLIGWVRDRVRRTSMAFIRPGDSLLELNAGTGIDSVHFAEQGVHVLATDQSSGMLERLRAKQRAELPLDVMDLSYHDLATLRGKRFDHVFSNFGGLNCTDRLDQVMKDAFGLLRVGGHLHVVIMPRTCLWELGWVLKGRFRMAFRRFRADGAQAHLEGIHFPCHYHAPSAVLRMLPEGFTVRALKGLSVVFPPPHAHALMARHPRLLRLLGRLEDALCDRWPFRGWGDHYLLIVRRTR